jgi:hypothetical protein
MPSNAAVFAQTPRILFGVLTTAITSINTASPVNLVQLGTAGANGSLMTEASVVLRGTTTAASALLYLSTDGGVTKYPIDSVLLAAYTNSATIKRPKANFAEITDDAPVRLPANSIIYAGTEVAIADGAVIKVELSDF